MVEQRYKSLRFISTTFKVLGVITLVIALLFALSLCSTGFRAGGQASSFLRDLSRIINYDLEILGPIISLVALIISIFPAIFGIIFAMILFPFGRGLGVLIDLEENSRQSISLLQRRTSVQYIKREVTSNTKSDNEIKLPTPVNICPNCEAEVLPSELYCVECGHKMTTL